MEETNHSFIVGITGSGMVVAEKLFSILKRIFKVPVQIITCHINKKQPEEISYTERLILHNKNILLVDDVTNSGRTLLYALKPLLQFYPKRIQTVSLVERMHKSFPVKIDYIGLSVATTLQDHIQVEVKMEKLKELIFYDYEIIIYYFFVLFIVSKNCFCPVQKYYRFKAGLAGL